MKLLGTLANALRPIPIKLILGLGNVVVIIYKGVREYLEKSGQDSLPDIPAAVILIGFNLVVSFFAILFQARKLEEKFESTISVSGPFQHTLPKRAEGRAMRTYKLKVTNKGGELIKNCEVKLLEMVNKYGHPSKEHGRPFKLTLENPPDILNTPLSKSFDIKPFDSIEVDIVQYDEPKAGNHVRMCYALQGNKDHDVYVNVPLDACPHVITVRVVAENSGRPVDKKYRFFVDGDGILKLEDEQPATGLD